MGMYNEVFKNCPDCGRRCMIQIHQVVLGFGEFHLDQPWNLEKFTMKELKEVREAIEGEYFNCDDCGCDFSAVSGEKEDKRKQIEDLFGV